MKQQNDPTTGEAVEICMVRLRDQFVVVDIILAKLFGLTTSTLLRALPAGAAEATTFELTARERNKVAGECDHLKPLRGSKTLPRAYTVEGIITAAMAVGTERAQTASMLIVMSLSRAEEFDMERIPPNMAGVQ
jgi:hypothetical protein